MAVRNNRLMMRGDWPSGTGRLGVSIGIGLMRWKSESFVLIMREATPPLAREAIDPTFVNCYIF